MVFGFFPKHEKFFDLFDQSVENLREGARLLKALLEDYTDVETKIKRIEDVEHKGDTLTHETIEHLNRIFVTPIDREDIHAIAEQVDDVPVVNNEDFEQSVQTVIRHVAKTLRDRHGFDAAELL